MQTALNELEKHGYLLRKKILENGKFVDMEYIFSDQIMPEALEAYQKKQAKKAETSCEKSGLEDHSPYPGFRDTEKSDTENRDDNIIYSDKINKDKNIYNNQSYQSKDNIDSKVDLEKNDKIDGLIQETEKQFLKRDSREDAEKLIKDNIDYDFYEEFFESNPDNSSDRSENTTFAANIGEIDMLVGIIVNTICSNAKAIRIGKQLISHSVVESRFKKIQMKHIEYVLKCLMLSTKDIKNPTAYITTALYNATFTCDFAESNELKNIDPALFIPEQFHDDEFKKKHYEHTSYRP